MEVTLITTIYNFSSERLNRYESSRNNKILDVVQLLVGCWSAVFRDFCWFDHFSATEVLEWILTCFNFIFLMDCLPRVLLLLTDPSSPEKFGMVYEENPVIDGYLILQLYKARVLTFAANIYNTIFVICLYFYHSGLIAL